LTNEQLKNYAIQEKEFSEVKHITIVTPPVMDFFMGAHSKNGAYLIHGVAFEQEKLLLYPRDGYLNLEPQVYDFPFSFSYETSMQKLRSLKNNDGDYIYNGDNNYILDFVVYPTDFNINVDINIALFYLDGEIYIVSINNECYALNSEGVLLSEL
jgi:hypothetical protein